MQADRQVAVQRPGGGVPNPGPDRLAIGPSWGPLEAPPDALTALLTAWRQLPPGAAHKPVREQLGEWLGWTEAIALSRALGQAPQAPAEASVAAVRDWAQAALERLVAELDAGFTDPVLVQGEPLPAATPLSERLAPHRLHHGQQQRAMAARVASVRERLRAKLATLPSARLQQLAQLDAVFEQALLEPERQRLATLVERLAERAAALQAGADPQGLDRLWTDQHALLRAELALRLQPVLGLILALQHDEPSA